MERKQNEARRQARAESNRSKEINRGSWTSQGATAAGKFLHGRWTAKQSGLVPMLKSTKGEDYLLLDPYLCSAVCSASGTECTSSESIKIVDSESEAAGITLMRFKKATRDERRTGSERSEEALERALY